MLFASQAGLTRSVVEAIRKNKRAGANTFFEYISLLAVSRKVFFDFGASAYCLCNA